MIHIKITKINRVTVHGDQLDISGRKVQGWRVSPNLLLPEA